MTRPGGRVPLEDIVDDFRSRPNRSSSPTGRRKTMASATPPSAYWRICAVSIRNRIWSLSKMPWPPMARTSVICNHLICNYCEYRFGHGNQYLST